MIQRILDARRLLACLLSAATGMALYFRAPFPEDNIFLRVENCPLLLLMGKNSL